IHLLRGFPAAVDWLDTLSNRLGVTSITWLEVMFGAPGKAGQAKAKAVLEKFDLYFPIETDQLWAMEQMERYRLSQGVGINDCLIASVASADLYTQPERLSQNLAARSCC